MDSKKFSHLKAAIRKRSESLKTPPKDNQTNRRQMDNEIQGLRKDRKKIVSEYLVTEGFADSFKDANIMITLMSEQWFNQILKTQ
jgi:hypothetical protein